MTVSQPKLPGMGRIPKVATTRVSHFDSGAAAGNPGQAIPGQLVMGARDLAHETLTRQWGGGMHKPGGFAEHDAHGFIQDGTGGHQDDHYDGYPESARSLYETHGGRFAKTIREELDQDGSSPSDMGMTAGGMAEHNAKVRQVKAHWAAQPTVHLPTNTMIHTGQSVDQTEGDAGELVTKRTAGGTPVRAAGRGGTDGQGYKQYTDVPESRNGRQRIEGIKSDLAGKGANAKIRKPAWVVKQGGRFFSLDGHHRIVAAREAGLSHVPVKLWDRDAENGL